MNVGILGANGYAGCEVLRLLLLHPFVDKIYVHARSNLGKKVDTIYPSFYEKVDLIYQGDEDILKQSDVIFAGLPHHASEAYGYKTLKLNKKFIDLGADFRLDNENDYKKWYGFEYEYKEIHKKQIYGLTEIYREDIKKASLIGNPGCFPTSIELALYPFLKMKQEFQQPLVIHSSSGVTGAGKSLSQTTHFATLNGGYHPYKIGNHRHIPEIKQELVKMYEQDVQFTFVPHLLPINRGILSSIYISLFHEFDLKTIYDYYQDIYQKETFIHVLPLGSICDLKYVAYSNDCYISLHKDDINNVLIIESAIDNMIKGTAGQAIQNMNLMFGFKEDTGLKMIGSSF